MGEDFPDEHARRSGRNIDTSGLVVQPGGETFRWRGKYEGDMNEAETLEVHLNVLGTFDPDPHRSSPRRPISSWPTAAP